MLLLREVEFGGGAARLTTLRAQDPALLRPGRLDRKIEFPNPSRREKRLIFQTITSKMSMGADVDLEDCACSLSAPSALNFADF
jgi:ATP-dependent 26S proteasome regulatory subunit